MQHKFGKEHRLKSKKITEQLFKKGKKYYSSGIILVSLKQKTSSQSPPTPAQVLFSVPKRNFKKAVDRNLLKRRMRESYRQILKNEREIIPTNNQWYFALLYKDNRIRDFNEIQRLIALNLQQLKGKHTTT